MSRHRCLYSAVRAFVCIPAWFRQTSYTSRWNLSAWYFYREYGNMRVCGCSTVLELVVTIMVDEVGVMAFYHCHTCMPTFYPYPSCEGYT